MRERGWSCCRWICGSTTACAPAAFDTAAGRTLYFERLQKELDLTPAQSEQIQSVLNDFWQYYRTVLSDSKQRVEQLLNDEQRKKFQRLLQQQTR